MASLWQPRQDGLGHILEVLRNANSSDNRIQLEVQKKLREFMQISDYNNYLMYILTQLQQEDPSVRAMAGLLLKNNVKHLGSKSGPELDFVKECSLKAIGDPLQLVRGTVGIFLTTLLSTLGLTGWPELVPRLIECIESGNQQAAEGAFSALFKVCEDHGTQLIEHPSRPLDVLVPKFIQYSASPNDKIREYALSCANNFIALRADAIFQNLPSYIQALSARANDPVGDVRKLVCGAFVMLIEVKPDFLIPQLASVANFMLFAMQDSDEYVSLESCEFWLAFAERDDIREYLRPFLQQLIPVLIKSMVYSESELSMLNISDDNEAVPDRAEDIKPRHHKAKTHALQHEEEKGFAVSESGSDDEDDDDDEVYSEWNLRKCAAQTLDVLSSVLGTEILTSLLPLLNEELFSEDWRHRELGILALGAIAEGCKTGIEPHLPQLQPYLVRCMRDPQPLVRSISCWTLSRYCSWCIYPTDGSDRKKYFEPFLVNLLESMMDKNKRVQEAAVSALATTEEVAREDMAPYIAEILQAISAAFTKYQSRNLLILFDAVGTLADCIGPTMAEQKHVEVIMPPLIQRWNALSDEDTGLFPLLEVVAIALGPVFEPYVPAVYDRCLRLIQKTVSEQTLHNQDSEKYDEPETDFLIVSLDLISALIQGLSERIEPIIISTQPPLLEVLVHVIKDESSDVRQSAFALLGDFAMYLFPILRTKLPDIMPIIIEQTRMSPAGFNLSAVNNAIWSCGEIALNWGQEIGPYVMPMVEVLIPLLNHAETARTLRENCGIALGRFGLVVPELIAPHLDHFAENWCRVLRYTRENKEKESAFRGFCRLMQLNPQGIMKTFPLFCESISAWRQLPKDLQQMFSGVLTGVKNMMGDQWGNYFSSFSPQLRERLTLSYNI